MNIIRATFVAGIPEARLKMSFACIRSFGLAMAIAAALSGCRSLEVPAQSSVSKTPLPTSTSTHLPDGSIRHDTNSPRVAQLWSEAEKAKNNREWDKAEGYIQDALVIQPKDGILWSRAADLKLTLLQPALAEKFAIRSIAFANDNRTLIHRNWLIIEHARDMTGDLLGVREAHKMVKTYQN